VSLDATAVADALVEWATEKLPALAGSYDFDPDSKDQPLPDVAAIVETEQFMERDTSLGLDIASGLDQVYVRTFRCALMFVVDPADAGAATAQLQGFVDTLAAALHPDSGDPTLGSRVQSTSPLWSASYSPPFVAFDDGTEGRAATFSLVVVETA
jgi:hypothetical protein